jgi:hypothetical protein
MNAPIVLFVYNRPKHTGKTLEFLAKNKLAIDSDLIVFSDASKSEDDQENVTAVRRICKEVEGFRSVKIIERVENYGLSKNIISGIDDVFKIHSKAIVLEDDIQTSENFLGFMNDALNEYESNRKVWHISGWTYPIENKDLPDAFFWRVMNCWGWGTWKDRWNFYKKNPERLINNWSSKSKIEFNVNGCIPFFSQVIGNYIGRNNTWAIFWYATIFENHGLCLTPRESLVFNSGSDGSGTHKSFNFGASELFIENDSIKLPGEVIESSVAIDLLISLARRKRNLIVRTYDTFKAVAPLWFYRMFKKRTMRLQ